MARKDPTRKDESAGEPEMLEQIVDTDVSEELRASFLEYSMSVIVARALPDVRDGLKPVQRRILYSMHDNGMSPAKGYSKCARVVGDVMGKYHPHGDMAIYEALVRMAQDFSLRLPVIDGHGNFGSLDDGPAASRYTECRLAHAAVVMVDELDENTVDFKANYDGREQEPKVLPAGLPNLLVNGVTGIAVGMATNMAPHNLGEVVAGLQAMLENPKITLDELMVHIPGPDLPTGGTIVGMEGVRDAYRTGRGQFRIRARAEVTDVSARRRGIVVTELPYLVGPEKVIARIKELINDKKLTGVSNVADYSDRKTGLRLVVECKTGFNPHAVLDELYRLTPLAESFSVNAVALVESSPQTLGLRELCHYYLMHRIEVTTRRTQFRRDKAAARAHILEGLLVALGDIDKVIALVKSSKDSATARTKLMEAFELSEIQAEAILEMTIRRLTSLEVGKVRDELKELHKTIKELDKLLGSDKAMRALVSTELAAMRDKLATPRRTRLLEGIPVSSHEAATLEIADDPCTVSINLDGVLARTEPGRAKKPNKTDLVSTQLATSARGQIGALTSIGRMIRMSVLDLPTKPSKASDIFGLVKDESVVAIVPITAGTIVALGTASGLVKRFDVASLPTKSLTSQVVALAEGDEVVGATQLDNEFANSADLVFVTSDGQLLRFGATTVRPQGVSSAGMAGVRLADGAKAVCFTAVPAGAQAVVVTVSDAGAAKSSPLSEYPAKGRGTGGVRCHSFRKAESGLATAIVGTDLVGVGQTGAPTALPESATRRDASGVPTDLKTAASVRL